MLSCSRHGSREHPIIALMSKGFGKGDGKIGEECDGPAMVRFGEECDGPAMVRFGAECDGPVMVRFGEECDGPAMVRLG